jgi:RND family efflux transporter MFP subunit
MKASTVLLRVILPLAALGALSAFVLRVRGRGGPVTETAASAATASLIRAEGRLVAYPDADVTVGTDLQGIVAQVFVEEGAHVRRGERLVELDASEQRAALAEAQAHSVEAEADLRMFESDVERVQVLKDRALASQQALDRAVRDRDGARARLDVARASVDRLSAVVRKALITSPIDGVVLERPVRVGEAVSAGDSIARVADLSRTRVEAEVDEFDAGSMRLGAAVQVTAEGYAGQSWAGRVEEIPDVVQGRRLKPQDPGRPQDTRVLLVKIALAEPTPLKLGQRVEVEITGAGAARGQ